MARKPLEDGDLLKLTSWWRRPLQRTSPTIDESCWQTGAEIGEALSALGADEKVRLQALAERFVATTRIDAAGGLDVTDAMRARVALQACLPILELGLDRYRDVSGVVLYPSGFIVDQRWTDDAGVEHERAAALSGEAWEGGPVILAWDDVESPDAGTSVVIHEFAHVLDGENGRTNGFPPIRDPVAAARWSTVFGAAYADHCTRVENGTELYLDEYGAEDEAEFFAVAVETFFVWPENVAEGYPDIYEALVGFFRQDPLSRVSS